MKTSKKLQVFCFVKDADTVKVFYNVFAKPVKAMIQERAKQM